MWKQEYTVLNHCAQFSSFAESVVCDSTILDALL